MAEYHLERLVDENAERWEGFNTTSPEGSLFHSLKWKEIVERDPGVKSHYFLLYKDDDVIGLFPFIEEKIRFFQGVSPAQDPQRLHAVLKEPGDPLAMDHLINELRKIRIEGKRLSFASLSTLHQETLDTLSEHPLLPLDDGLGEMILTFSELPPEQIWSSLTSNRRKKIRMFDKDGFAITEVRSRDDLEQFYRYYYDNVTYVGGSPQPFSRFSDLWNSMSDEIRITVLSQGSRIAGGLFQFKDVPRKTAHGTYLSLNRDLPNKYSPSYYLWWEALTWAQENNFEKFSFGAQHLDPDNPRFKVKHDMGGRFEPIYSKIIPLTRLFSLGSRSMNYLVRLNARHQRSISAS